MHHQRWGGFNKKATCEGLGSSRKSRSLEGEGEQKCCGEYPNRTLFDIFEHNCNKLSLKIFFIEQNSDLFILLMEKTALVEDVVREKPSI